MDGRLSGSICLSFTFETHDAPTVWEQWPAMPDCVLSVGFLED